MIKIIIVGADTDIATHVAKGLLKADDNMIIAPVFNTLLEMRNHSGDILYYMSNEEVELSYKNNAFMWVLTKDHYSLGVTKLDMYTSNIFTMSFPEFNNMANPILDELKNDDFFIVVLDDSHTKKNRHDINDAKNSFERIYNNHYLYFLNESPEKCIEVILKYIIASAEERKNIEESLNS